MSGQKADPRFRQKLKLLRLASGFTQQNVADALAVNRATYAYYELGKTMPDIPTLGKLAKIFDVPVAIFFAEELPKGMRVVRDSKGNERKRPGKVILKNPSQVGDLSPEEKALVALLRSNNQISTTDTILAVRQKLGMPLVVEDEKSGEKES